MCVCVSLSLALFLVVTSGPNGYNRGYVKFMQFRCFESHVASEIICSSSTITFTMLRKVAREERHVR